MTEEGLALLEVVQNALLLGMTVNDLLLGMASDALDYENEGNHEDADRIMNTVHLARKALG